MIIAPSPEALLHKKQSIYGEKLQANYSDETLGTTKKQVEDFDDISLIDLSFFLLNGENPTIKYSPFKAACILSKEINTNNSFIPLFYAILALKKNDIKEAIYFLKDSAQKGNINAINLLGFWLMKYPEFFRMKSEESLNKSKLLLKNSIRMNSTDALFLFGIFYGKDTMSLYYYKRHFKLLDSIISASKICSILTDVLHDEEITRRWILFCIASGEPKFIKKLIHKHNETSEVIQFWTEKYNSYCSKLPLNKKFQFNEKLYDNSPFENELKIEKKSSILLKEFPKIIPSTLSEYQPSFQICKYRNESKCENNSTSKNLIGFYPINNKTQIILKLFELTSDNYNIRNLKLAEIVIYQISTMDSIINSKLFQTKLKSKNNKWLTSCGFICSLFGDLKSAFELFLKASTLGNETATFMCGFLLFHYTSFCQGLQQSDCHNSFNPKPPKRLSLINSISAQYEFKNLTKKSAGIFFGKCCNDPLSLIHLGLILNDDSKLDIACSKLGISSKTNAIAWAGKLLYDGIKFPSLSQIPSKMFFLAAITHGINHNEDVSNIYNFYLENFT